MNWFGYVWIVALVIVYVIWTIECIRDFIDDVKAFWMLPFLFRQGTSWSWWIVLHAAVIIACSLAYFLLMIGGAE